MGMTIKDGYNSKPLHIRVSGRESGPAELWIKQEGLPEGTKDETLSYIDILELIAFRDELNEAIKEIVGL